MSGNKKYTLTIEYNEDTEQIEYIQEEVTGDEDTFEYGDIIINDYFDEETLKWISEMYILGIS